MQFPGDVFVGGGELQIGRVAMLHCVRNLADHTHSLKGHAIAQQQHSEWMAMAKESNPKISNRGYMIMLQLMTDRKGLGTR